MMAVVHGLYLTHLKLRARNRVLVPHNLPLVSRGLLVISRYCEPKFVQVMNQEFFTVNDGLPTTQNVRPPGSYLTLCPAGASGNAHGPRRPGITSTGVGISHSARALVAPRTLPSRANCRARRSETPSEPGLS